MSEEVCGTCEHASYIGPEDDHACRRYPPTVVVDYAYIWRNPNRDKDEIQFYVAGKLPTVGKSEKACGEYKKRLASNLPPKAKTESESTDITE